MPLGNEGAARHRPIVDRIQLFHLIALLLVCAALSCTEKRPVTAKKK